MLSRKQLENIGFKYYTPFRYYKDDRKILLKFNKNKSFLYLELPIENYIEIYNIKQLKQILNAK